VGVVGEVVDVDGSEVVEDKETNAMAAASVDGVQSRCCCDN